MQFNDLFKIIDENLDIFAEMPPGAIQNYANF